MIKKVVERIWAKYYKRKYARICCHLAVRISTSNLTSTLKCQHRNDIVSMLVHNVEFVLHFAWNLNIDVWSIWRWHWNANVETTLFQCWISMLNFYLPSTKYDAKSMWNQCRINVELTLISQCWWSTWIQPIVNVVSMLSATRGTSCRSCFIQVYF